MTADREAAIRDANDWLWEVDGLGMTPVVSSAFDIIGALLAELAAAREREARWESIAAERGVRMDEIQARAEDAEIDAANARSSRDELLAEARERNEKLREALREIRDYEWHPGQPATDVREIARAALAEGEG